MGANELFATFRNIKEKDIFLALKNAFVEAKILYPKKTKNQSFIAS
jgi:hypothetical protein